ncbi:MAG: class I SAM-dependent methyltransferase [Bdellovibrionales bacterium]|nr:class I SAM-dependent methyltransferase [Oligoflexia bacterium]
MSLVIREVCRISAFEKFIHKLDLRSGAKILDVGCGDGKWWQTLNPNTTFEVYGIDINCSEILKAKKHINAQVLNVTDPVAIKTLPQNFDLVVGNCSLEHVPDINSALTNIRSVCANDAHFILFVPSPHWALKGKSINFLHWISPRLSMAYSGAINGFFQHWHLYDYRIWNHLLQNNGFEVIQVSGLGTRRLEFLYRLFLPSAFLSFLVKTMTGKYFNHYACYLIPNSINRAIANKLVPLIENSIRSPDDVEEIFEYAILTRVSNA